MEVKERPILMTPANAQKCFVGTKTQTRRIISEKDRMGYPHHEIEQAELDGFRTTGGMPFLWKCPYGVVGDRLWVREAWCCGRPALPSGRGIIPYYGKLDECPESEKTKVVYRGSWGEIDPPKWRPSIHMTRWACRMVMELMDIRVQRLQDISPEDALAEGIFCPEVGYAQHGKKAPVLLFAKLWESINGACSWQENPFVWCLTLRRSAG